MLRTLFLALTVLLAAPLAANFIGWNLFLMNADGDRLRTVACSGGVLHLSDLEDLGAEEPLADLPGDLESVTLAKLGNFELFLEPKLDPVQPFRVHSHRDGADRVLEIPWLILPAVTLLMAFFCPKRRRSSPE